MVSRFTDTHYLQATQSSLHWPQHWRKSIFKLTANPDGSYIALPYNPAYRDYLSSEREFYGGPDTTAVLQPPPTTLDPIHFETLQELDQWASVVARLL